MGLTEGKGTSSILNVGTTVWVIFEDHDVNLPIILGTFIGPGDIQLEDYHRAQTIRSKNNNLTLKDCENARVDFKSNKNQMVANAQDFQIDFKTPDNSVSLSNKQLKFKPKKV